MRRPSATAAAMVAKLSSASTISATFLVTSVPVTPMPTPMSAAFTAGASFTPSPVMAVTQPRCCQARTMRALCWGCTRAYTENSGALRRSSSSLMASSAAPVTTCPALLTSPSVRPMAAAVSGWSPVIITVRMPADRQARTAPGTWGRTGSSMPTSPRNTS